jgi:hypothetical protein
VRPLPACAQVCNPSPDVPAVTLHLYSPPFDRCRVWLDCDRASRCLTPVTTYHSEYGTPVTYELNTGGVAGITG